MIIFIKYFCISLSIQAIFIGMTFLTGVGGYFVAILYEAPIVILFSVAQFPQSTNGSELLFYGLFLIPAILYSLLIGLAALIVSSLRRRRRPRGT